ncbi:hypothetical protein BH10ACI1_BH10ACI1_13860 [soil metagenome]
MKLTEQLFGKGDVFDKDENLGKINYRLFIHQDTFDVNGEEIEGLKSVSGSIDSNDAMRLFDKNNLILNLEDGRWIEFLVCNLEGEVQCSGDFFTKES